MRKFLQKYDPNALLGTAVILLGLAVFASLIGYGVFVVWNANTGFFEMNHPAFKAQEAKHPKISDGVVMIGEDEPKLETAEQISAIKNPVAPTEESLASGKDSYETYCSPCHGKTGDGQGLMGTVPALGRISDKEKEELSEYLSGFIGKKPDINLNFFKDEEEAQLYKIISDGGEIIMPGFYDAMDPDQRWDLVNYIKIGLKDSGV